jgi:toxin ParE1/3/4
MSAHKFRLVVSPRAKEDLGDILLHTQRQWGRQQRATYKAIIHHALTEITLFPGIGQSKEHLRPGLHSFLAKQHVIYYRIEPGIIRVERILHVRMDADAELD